MTPMTLAIGNKTLAYLQVGSGTAVVMIHNMGGHKEDWQGVAAALATAIWSIQSTCWAWPVRALLKAGGLTSADIVGNSVGGWVAAAFAAYVKSGEKAISATRGKSLYISTRLEDPLPKIKAQMLVLWGADDKLFPSVLAGTILGQITGATSQLTPAPAISRRLTRPRSPSRALQHS